jgi:hypothetical protein
MQIKTLNKSDFEIIIQKNKAIKKPFSKRVGEV